ncbi:MAG TPA: reverse transcriptase family protein [Burkholderiales bacterium]|nr:reverse transcriptase family protein [Burkholderiales bacterium]
MRFHCALSLADAMLSGPPTPASVRARCTSALGGKAGWLASLSKDMLQEHTATWHPNIRKALARSILKHPAFQSAWSNPEPPHIRRYFLTSPALGRPPFPLQHCALPDLPTTGDIAKWLKLELPQLEWFADIAGRNVRAEDERLRHYVYRWVAKRSGGFRLLEIPKTRLRALQRRLLHELIEYVPPHEAAHGFRARHSCLTSAVQHLGRQIVVRMDLQDFFVSVSALRISAFFRTLGYPEGAARVLTGLCTSQVPSRLLDARDPAKYEFEQPTPDWLTRKRFQSPHLPQGAPTSPALANLCAFNLDLRLQAAAESLDARYTRYADDLVFSGGRQFEHAVGRFIPLVGAIALEEGFSINFRKTHVMNRSSCQKVNGIVVNERMNVARRERDQLKAILHNCMRHGPTSQNRAGLADFRAHLKGRLAYVKMIAPLHGQRMELMFEQIIW